MARISAYHEGLVEEYVLGFLWSHPMPFPVLVGIGVVPVKPSAVLQRIHGCHKSVYDHCIQARPASTAKLSLPDLAASRQTLQLRRQSIWREIPFPLPITARSQDTAIWDTLDVGPWTRLRLR